MTDISKHNQPLSESDTNNSTVLYKNHDHHTQISNSSNRNFEPPSSGTLTKILDAIVPSNIIGRFSYPGVHAFEDRHDESPFWRAAERSLYFGILGASTGTILASVRNANLIHYAGTMGFNYTFVAFSYFSISEAAKIALPNYRDTWQIHAGVGTVLGTGLGLMFSSPRKLPNFIGAFVALGVGDYFILVCHNLRSPFFLLL